MTDGGTLTELEALAVAWCVLRPGEAPPEPWCSAWAPLGELPRLAVLHAREEVSRLALAALRLADWPSRGTPAQRFEVCQGAAVAAAAGLDVTPGTIRDMTDPDKVVDAALRAITREKMRRERER